METASNLVADAKPDWARLLPPEVLFELMRVLRAALPPPLVDAPGEQGRGAGHGDAARGTQRLRLLLRLQAMRMKLAKDGAAATTADWVEHAVLNLMGEALATIAPRPGAAGSLPKFRHPYSDEIEAPKTRAETTSGPPLTDALPGASRAGSGAEPHA